MRSAIAVLSAAIGILSAPEFAMPQPNLGVFAGLHQPLLGRCRESDKSHASTNARC